MKIDYSAGSFLPKDDLTLPYIWVSLHLNAQMEHDTQNNPKLSRETARMTSQIVYLLEALKEVPAQNWWAICEASGWTVYGAVGLSWCQNTTPELFWRAWSMAGYPLKPGAISERPCRLINSEVLPQSATLTEITAECANQCEPICVCIAALEGELVIDISEAQVLDVGAPLRAFLASRLGEPTTK